MAAQRKHHKITKLFQGNISVKLINLGKMSFLFLLLNTSSYLTFYSDDLSSPQNYINRRSKEYAVSATLEQVGAIMGRFSESGAIRTLSIAEAEELAATQGEGIETEFGSYNYTTRVQSRSAPRTFIFGSDEVRDSNLNPIQKSIATNLQKTLAKVQEYLTSNPFYHVRGYLGRNPEWTPECNLYVSAIDPKNVRLAHMIAQTLFEEGTGQEQPNYTIVYIPE